jgi:SAM-dependent methyltransferase
MTEDTQGPRLYGDLAGWFHLLTAPGDYAEEAALYRTLLDSVTQVRTVLELGSGGGNNASHLKAWYELTLVDVSAAMLDLSRGINAGCEHHAGDMRTVRLDRRFDAVFVHDAIDYLTTLEDLLATVETAYVHLRPGGVVLLVPDVTRETFAPATDHGGHDDGSRGLRYLEWTRDPDPTDTTYTTDYAYLLRDGDDVRVEHDRHVLGLFAHDQWLATLHTAGFRDVRAEPGLDGATCFLALR